MKTQISNLRSGTKNQILNKEIDYSQLPPATSHIGHSGTNADIVAEVWKKIKEENPDSMKIKIKGKILSLKANWSGSLKSVSYVSEISKEFLEEGFHMKSAENRNPYISIQFGNIILLHNGKNSFCSICPSLIEILQ